MSSDVSSTSDEEMEDLIIEACAWWFNAAQVCMRDNWNEVRNDMKVTGKEWILNILDNHHPRCYESFRLSTDNFNILCDELREKGLVSNGDVIIEEQVAMFLQIVGHATDMRKVGEDFQHSTETVWRCFNKVLHCVLLMQSDYIKLPGSNAPIHPELSEGTIYAPFKDALGAVDGTHILAFPDRDDEFSKERFRNSKHGYSQNVMAAVDFDGNFLAVVAGWEGSAHDNSILRKAVEDGFVVPSGKYYLVDGGYANTSEFLGPYRGKPYQLAEFCAQSQNQNQYECPEDLFNYRHAQLKNIVEKTFGILKTRFKICQWMRKYKFKTQTKVVIACCVLHNFIKHHNRLQGISDEELFNGPAENDLACGDDSIVGDMGASDTPEGDHLRSSIKNILWATR
ncbi:nuclease [Rhynchospora pubera]|uniref:Nuclease n=1 Tax=Rhynchospora pubera TaxID=906938 RepID=A0AAV8D9M0_9POAL|nr:nuclease [Rhynchospora pubera]